MNLKIRRPLKRAAVLASVAGVSLALMPGAPALAATSGCTQHSTGTVTFSVCAAKVNSTTAKAYVTGISGTYISGELALFKGYWEQKVSCEGKFYPGETCSFTVNNGSGTYQAWWRSAGGLKYTSPKISF